MAERREYATLIIPTSGALIDNRATVMCGVGFQQKNLFNGPNVIFASGVRVNVDYQPGTAEDPYTK